MLPPHGDNKDDMNSKILGLGLLFILSGEAGLSQSGISTQIIDPTSVTRIATSLNHISVIDMPEPIMGATVGSDVVRMEYRDHVVLIEPLKAGVQTDLFVWTAHTSSTFEVLPAGSASGLSYSIREIFPPPPPPPPGPSPIEAQRLRDLSEDALMLTMRNISQPHYWSSRNGVTVRATSVSEDAYSYYVRLDATNRTSHLYRVATPVVNRISPVFGERMAVRWVNVQLSEKTFSKVQLYDSEELLTHGSTLQERDLRPGETVQWVMAVQKPKHARSMYEFVLPQDGEVPVRAVVVF